jgi:hypothetical protein
MGRGKDDAVRVVIPGVRDEVVGQDVELRVTR